jgi:hypothetical protein
MNNFKVGQKIKIKRNPTTPLAKKYAGETFQITKIVMHVDVQILVLGETGAVWGYDAEKLTDNNKHPSWL